MSFMTVIMKLHILDVLLVYLYILLITFILMASTVGSW